MYKEKENNFMVNQLSIINKSPSFSYFKGNYDRTRKRTETQISSITSSRKFTRKGQKKFSEKLKLGLSFQADKNVLKETKMKQMYTENSINPVIFPNNDIKSYKDLQKIKQSHDKNKPNDIEEMSYDQMAQAMKQQLHKPMKPLRTNIQDFIHSVGNKLRYIKVKSNKQNQKTFNTNSTSLISPSNAKKVLFYVNKF